MRVHNKGVMFRKTDVYCSFLRDLTLWAGKRSLNNSYPVHLCVQGEIFSSRCWFDLIQISTVGAVSSRLSITVGPVCIVGPVFEWIMIHWAVTRGTNGQRNISLSVYTSHYLSTLSPADEPEHLLRANMEGASIQKLTADSSWGVAAMLWAWPVSLCSLWCNLTIKSGPHDH